ncbi:heterokaryon incompatibility protein-domain-containing protein [Pisolithus marmoratus]|nr:heterokaryon incompatibility protein-domain-containing protein [Pisolithus marmoratus]
MDVWRCRAEPHQCGKMIIHDTIVPRCKVYRKDYESVVMRGAKYLDWWATIGGGPISTESSISVPYTRPGNYIQAGKLVDSTTTTDPYIAISYVWDVNPSFVEWEGREVTLQALRIVEQLSKYTSYALWVDAICIPQNDIPVKEVELQKMADIYRGAIAVLCLVPEADRATCAVVERSAALMNMEGFRALEKGGDTHGMYMFASHGSNETLRKLFGSRWWTRAWTLQEAVLNNSTYIVGENMETIPISDILKICGPIARRAATQKKEVLGQSSSFWDSLNSMKMATNDRMPLGTAMSTVWRRQCKVPHDMAYSLLGVCRLQEIRPNYHLPLEEVFVDLVEKACSAGDFSWLRWTHLIDRSDPNRLGRMSMVPTPATIKSAPASTITTWHSIEIPQLPSLIRGGEFGSKG